MTQQWLFLLYLAICSDLVASLVGAIVLYRYRNGITRMLAILLLSIFIEGVFMFSANTAHPAVEYRSQWFIWNFWIGRIVRSAGMWVFVLYLFKRSRN